MSNRGNYIPALDGLRALAVTLVMLTHLSHSLFPGGDIGVDVFFVLSGFLITGILLREYEVTGRILFGAFYARRLLRLMPALTLMVLITLCFELAIGGPGPNKVGSAVAALLYMMDFVRTYSEYSELSTLGHTWSLAVEEHFYIIWPLLIGILFTIPARMRAPSCVIAIGILVSWRIWGTMNGFSHDRVYYAFDMRADQLLVGCALAAWLAAGLTRRSLRIPQSLAWAALLFIAGVSLAGTGNNWALRALVPLGTALASAVLILGLIGSQPTLLSRIFEAAPLVGLGRISYGIYLWHWPLLIETRFLWPANKWLALIAVLFSIPVALFSFHFVEKPFLRLKRHFERGADGPVHDAGAIETGPSMDHLHREGGITLRG